MYVGPQYRVAVYVGWMMRIPQNGRKHQELIQLLLGVGEAFSGSLSLDLIQHPPPFALTSCDHVSAGGWFGVAPTVLGLSMLSTGCIIFSTGCIMLYTSATV